MFAEGFGFTNFVLFLFKFPFTKNKIKTCFHRDLIVVVVRFVFIANIYALKKDETKKIDLRNHKKKFWNLFKKLKKKFHFKSMNNGAILMMTKSIIIFVKQSIMIMMMMNEIKIISLNNSFNSMMMFKRNTYNNKIKNQSRFSCT